MSDNKELGQWAGLCKVDKDGNPRKVVGASCVAITDYGPPSGLREGCDASGDGCIRGFRPCDPQTLTPSRHLECWELHSYSLDRIRIRLSS